MRTIFGVLDAHYTGRGETILDKCLRRITIKDDNSIIIDNSETVKPLNYMKNAVITEYHNEGILVLKAESKGEMLVINVYEVLQDSFVSFEGIEDTGLKQIGTEKDLQYWLFSNLNTLRANIKPLQLEFDTGNGPVDILAEDTITDDKILIEVKRVANKNAVHQLKKYYDGVNSNTLLNNSCEPLPLI